MLLKTGAIALWLALSKQTGATTWSYTRETGTELWGDLDPEYRVCSSGKAQSPINLKSGVTSTVGNLKFDYRDTPVVIINNGRTI